MTYAGDQGIVVVGVDGSERNQPAIEYAVASALASQRPLMLVSVVSFDPAEPHRAESGPDREWTLLEDIRDRLVEKHPRLRASTSVRFGHPVSSLVSTVGERDLLVVGKRGMGPSRAMRIGSTAIRLAAVAPSLLAVVPPRWQAPTGHPGPVVVGVDSAWDNEKTLRLAFLQALRTGAPLCVVSATDLRPALVWDRARGEPAYRQWERRSAAALAEMIGPLRDQFPDVEVTVADDHGHAADVLTAQARTPQLIVLARRDHHGESTGLGAVAREVLDVAAAPVLVVPVEETAESDQPVAVSEPGWSQVMTPGDRRRPGDLPHDGREGPRARRR